MRRVLTSEQIQYAKELKEAGYSMRKIGEILSTPRSTIWENVFRKYKRIKIHIRPTEQCARCEIRLTSEIDIKRRFVPMNYKINGICLDCYLRERGIHYGDVMVLLDYYGK